MFSEHKKYQQLYYKAYLYLCILIISFTTFNCSNRFEPEPLTTQSKQNLALLQQEPQFVMYMNFKKMRETDFWEKFISDSLFREEKNFGSFLYILKEVTGASISEGLDELYYSNSWFGENAMVIRGVFDRKKVDDYITGDSTYATITSPSNPIIYHQKFFNFYFYFRDEFTVCGSNYLKHLQSTFSVTDTSKTGLLLNNETVSVIENIKFKDNLWMMSNQKLFIRGIFENFTEFEKLGKKEKQDSVFLGEINPNDTLNEKEGVFDSSDLYDKINAVSFSLKMTNKLDIIMQNECTDEKASGELKNKIEGILALLKLSTELTGKKQTTVSVIFEKLKIERFGSTVLLEANINEEQITEFRRQK